MTAAVRKKDEELTINLKCIIGVLMTDSGLYCLRFPFHAKNFRSARQQNISRQRCHIERFSRRFCVHRLPPFSKPYTHFPFRNRYRKMTELMLQVSGYAQKITRISGIRRTVTVM